MAVDSQAMERCSHVYIAEVHIRTAVDEELHPPQEAIGRRYREGALSLGIPRVAVGKSSLLLPRTTSGYRRRRYDVPHIIVRWHPDFIRCIIIAHGSNNCRYRLRVTADGSSFLCPLFSIYDVIIGSSMAFLLLLLGVSSTLGGHHRRRW